MKRRKNKNLDVTARQEELEDEVITRLLEALDEENSRKQEIEEKILFHKRMLRIKICVITALIVFLTTGSYLLIHFQTYTKVRTVAVYKENRGASENYAKFADGVLRYSRDGVTFLSQKGEEKWNQPYQIKNPVIEIYGESAAIADKGGNTIEVFDKEGLKGEIHTILPIERFVISSKGIVGVILKNDISPKIICYDAVGNILAEVKTSLVGTGYPMDISLSEDGKILMVSYLSVKNSEVSSKINFYDFSGKVKEEKRYQILSDTFRNMIAPSVFCMNQTTFAAAGDDRLLIYKNNDRGKPELEKTIKIKEKIKSIFYNEKYMGLILQGGKKSENRLEAYNLKGEKVMSENIEGEYTNAKIYGNQILLYDGKKCSIFLKGGVHKFEGEFDDNILEMFPIFGVNKYMVMNKDGIKIVRLVK